MFKKVQTRLILLISAVTLFFLTIFLFLVYSEVKRETVVFHERQIEQEDLFDKIVNLKGKPLEIIVDTEYSIWTEMVEFARSPERFDREWRAETIDWLLKNYDFDATWVYDLNFSPIYEADKFNDGTFREAPVPKGVLKELFGGNLLIHFFADTPHGLMEVRGASIHVSVDTGRKTPPTGYFLAGRIWDKGYVREISDLTGCSVEIVMLKPGEPIQDMKSKLGAIAFSRLFSGWDGSSVALAKVRSQSRIFFEVRRLSRMQLIFVVSFMCVTLLILIVTLIYWVNSPLRLISASLKGGNPQLLGRLSLADTEFGNLARLIVQFFDQRKALINEIGERKRAEEELELAKADLEDWSRKLEDRVRERTDDLRNSQEKLMRQEKFAVIGQIAASVSHEIRTPLTAMKNAVYFLKMFKSLGQYPKVVEYLELIDREIDFCSQVIGNMLDFAGPKEPIRKMSRLNEVVGGGLSMPIIPQNIEIITDFDESLPPVIIDPLQIKLVCENIFQNAVEAMRGGGTFTARTSRSENFAVIEFKDTGVGIPASNLKKIFDPLFSTFPRGTGLGLVVCQQIVEAHGGTIEVESEVGEGTIFRIKLPLQ